MNKRLTKIYTILLLIATLIFTSIYIYLPNEINIIEGKQQIFKFNLPLVAQINSEKKGVMYLNNEKVAEDKIKINLKEPFSLQLLENGNGKIDFNLFGIPLKSAKIDTIPNTKLVPVGKVMGIRIFTDGIMVLGTGYVNGADGKIYEPSKDILQTGDLILEVNEEYVDSKEKLIKILQKNKDKNIKLKINRNEKIEYKEIKPVISVENKENKIGIWVRDSTQGIGTITYYNPKTGIYGALGHGIQDIDTNELMKVRSGKILKSNVTYIKRGEKGEPGELMGIIIDTSNSTYGNVIKNTTHGIFGKVKDEKKFSQNGEFSIGLKEEVKPGKAYIYSDILGKGAEKFEVEIQNINTLNYEVSKGMIIRIVDKRLLESTNGIIQGMSGSPIIQNNKIIGAVTHVFVNDPSKGYGIFIENMLKEEKNIM